MQFDRAKTKKWLVIGGAAALGVPTLVFVIYTWITLTYSFSKGERAGYIQKLSERGWVCKTFEGELALANFAGTTPEKFYFTVRDRELTNRINAFSGTKVVVEYEEHRGIPVSCFGDSAYFVTNVRKVTE